MRNGQDPDSIHFDDLLDGFKQTSYLLREDFETRNQRFWASQTELAKARSNKKSATIILSEEDDDDPEPSMVSPKKRARK